MKILFAEDEEDLQDVVAEYLRYQGYNVTAVSNGAEAVEKAASDAYDALVLDVMMPVMDGITAIKKIREMGNTIPAIFLTAKSQVGDRIEGLDAGADDYLTKPFSMEELSARLRALYRRKRDYKVRTLSFGNMELDTEQSEMKAVNTISLAYKEMRLIALLIGKAGEEVSVKEIMDEVWPGEDVNEDMVVMYISFLRGKLRAVQANVAIEGESTFCMKEIRDV
ncbi:MAG: response regulator transcription factor [Lachnospiraceae bacterium]|nr:response regulator transcription factor [Lachnospiraceae bacterium]